VSPVRYAGGVIYPTANGAFDAQFWHANKRHRKRLSTLAQAKAWLLDVKTTIEREETPLDTWAQRDAAKALGMLPEGVSLVDAAEHYLRTAVAQSVTIREAVAALLSSHHEHLRPRSVQNLRLRLGRLVEDIGDRIIGEIRTADIEAWIASLSVGPQSQINYLSTTHLLFDFAQRRDWCRANPVARIPRPRVAPKDPGILSVEQAKGLLVNSQVNIGSGLLPIVALGLFLGIRPAEARRMTWEDIDWQQGHVLVGRESSKTRERRYGTLCPALRSWLMIVPEEERAGPIAKLSGGIDKQLLAARRAAGIKDWPHDALRHSFCSYHLALHQDAAKTAFELGHARPTTLYRHYRNLVTSAEGEAYFALRPETPPRNQWEPVPGTSGNREPVTMPETETPPR